MVAKRPAQRLPLAVAALVGVGIAGFALWLLAGIAGSRVSPTSGDTLVQATVVAPGSCQGSDNHDSVKFTLDGTLRNAKLDACGHSPGERVGVLAPVTVTGDTLVEPADAAPGDAAGASQRMAFGLLIIATAVGGGCAYLFFRDRRPAGPPRARPTGRPTAPRPRGRRKRPSGRHGDDRGRDGEPTGDWPVRGRAGDPDATGVDWFEDSATSLPIDLNEHADRQ